MFLYRYFLDIFQNFFKSVLISIIKYFYNYLNINKIINYFKVIYFINQFLK